MIRLGSKSISLILSILLLTLSIHSASGQATLLGSNIRVTTENFPTASTFGYGSADGGPADILQQNEPSIAVNPSDSNQIAIGVNDVRSLPQTGDAWQGLAFSNDGGTSWAESLIPGYPGDPGCSTTPKISPVCSRGSASDPYVAFDTANNLFFAFIAYNRPFSNSAVAVAKYGTSESSVVYMKTVIVEAATSAQQLRFGDKEALAVDVSPSSPFKDNVYVSWTRFVGSFDHLYFSRSTDQGESYSRPIKLDRGSPLIQGSAIAVAPDGTIYIAYRKFQMSPMEPQVDAIYVVKSRNGGVSFSKPILVQFIRSFTQLATRDPPIFRVTSFPWVAADENGVYVAWSNLNPSSGADIQIRRSRDGDASWEPVVSPHSLDADLGTSGNGHQFMPAMAATEGKISIVWYDSRSEPSFNPSGPVSGSGFGATGIGMDVYYTQADTAADGPLTFEAPIRVTSQSFNPNLYGSILGFSPFIGDYIGVAVTSTKALVVWADNRDTNDAEDMNNSLFQEGGSLPCPSPCSSLSPSQVNQRAIDSNVYFQVITK